VYPMNWAWWDGKMTRHHYQDEHGLDTSAIVGSADEAIQAESAVEEESEVTGVKHGH
jgi:hypothetical protein